MILGYNFKDRVAKIQGFDKSVWTVPLGRVRLGKTLPDLGTLLMERKCNPCDTQQDIEALREEIEAWPDFEEKASLLEICDKYIAGQQENARIVKEAALREAYGILHGTIISRGLLYGKLTKHADVITHVHVVDAVNFLVTEMKYFASETFPSPKSILSAVRAAQRSPTWRKYAKKLREVLKGSSSFEIFTAFRVASYLEKVTMPRTNNRVPSGEHTMRFALNHPTKKGD